MSHPQPVSSIENPVSRIEQRGSSIKHPSTCNPQHTTSKTQPNYPCSPPYSSFTLALSAEPSFRCGSSDTNSTYCGFLKLAMRVPTNSINCRGSRRSARALQLPNRSSGGCTVSDWSCSMPVCPRKASSGGSPFLPVILWKAGTAGQQS